eukprot:1033959-Pyramimonas_sp.AAC.2
MLGGICAISVWVRSSWGKKRHLRVYDKGLAGIVLLPTLNVQGRVVLIPAKRAHDPAIGGLVVSRLQFSFREMLHNSNVETSRHRTLVRYKGDATTSYVTDGRELFKKLLVINVQQLYIQL